MKVAFIGNMNNNNFALMRYFRDLGADAHLFLWHNDGIGSLSHFTPESDSWEIERWSKYIHQTDLSNTLSSVFGDPKRLTLPVSAKRILSQIGGFDAYVGSGIAPALLARAGIYLDIFYPYSTGVEFVGIAPSGKSIKSENILRRIILSYLKMKQVKGIRKSKYCLNAELGPTQFTLDSLGVNTLPLAIPMVYNLEQLSESKVSPKLTELKSVLRASDFKVFSHGRQLWKKTDEYSDVDWLGMNKNNDWLIQGFSDFIKYKKAINPFLVLLDYGPDAKETRKLCAELQIEQHVIWLPKMSRKEILFALSLCDVGTGEFIVNRGCIWGGTGWETLSSGKPLLQTFNFSKEEFFQNLDIPHLRY